MSFVFFDTETTGLRRGFDQIIHFAAIKTNNDLVEIDRFEARCRLLPYVVPNPAALRIGGRTIEQLTDKDLPSHCAMVGNIQRTLINWSPSIFVGYNSIRFDEHMLRHALFQTLRPAYLTSNHGNGRADALTLMMAASALSPAAITVPQAPDGRPTFRLGPMASANNVMHALAHDAMSDVSAMIELCRLVHERSSDVWQRFVRFSNRNAVRDFVDSGDGFIFTEFFGGEAYHAPVVCVGLDPSTSAGRFCLSLDSELERLASASDGELQALLAVKASPMRQLRVNGAPTITALFDASDEMLNGKSVDELEESARRLREDGELCRRLVASYVAGRKPWPPSPYVEQRLYDGFPNWADEHLCSEFHEVNLVDAYAAVERMQDDRLRAFGLRLVYLEDKSVLTGEARLTVEREFSGRLVDDGPDGYSLQLALLETDALLAGEPGSQVLSGYRAYLVDRIERVRRYMKNQLGIDDAGRTS